MADEYGNDNSAYIAASAQLLGQAGNIAAAAAANRKGRQWALEQYQRQRADALADWSMQNEYNSPAAQMKRLIAAGLNPNLVYGGGAGNMQSAQVRGSTPQSWKPEPPNVDLTGAARSFLSHTDLEMRQAQTDNIKANNRNIMLDSILKAGQINQLGVQTEKSQFELQQLKNLALLQVESATVGVEKQKADLQYTIDENERKALSNAQSLQMGIQTIANMKTSNEKTQDERNLLQQQLKNAQVQEMLSRADLALKDKGIQPSDPIYARVAAQILDYLKRHMSADKIREALPDWLFPTPYSPKSFTPKKD